MPLERRRHLRHKVHSPAYASVGTGAGGVVLDANERGAAIETVAHLVPQSFVDLRLDLLETRGSAVTPARVAWCDGAGRAGLEFLKLTGESRRQLQQWLLLNALLGTENATAMAPPASVAPVPIQPAEPCADPVLQRAAEQALAAAAADGAAIAVAEGSDVVCQATAGDIAPPPGTKLDTQSGISGASVRSGRWLRCDDPRLDPHVDRGSCEALGINSVLAVPIGERGNVLGLIEVFSRQLHAFQEGHCAALQELARNLAQWLRPPAAASPSPATTTAQPAPSVEPAPSAVTAPLAPPTPSPPPALVERPVTAAIPAAPPAAEPAKSAPAAAVQPLEPPSSSEKLEFAGAARQRIILLVLLAAFTLAGLWLVLGRGAGATKSVDAAETPAVDSPDMERVNTPAADAALPPAEAAAEFPDSLRELRRRAEAGDAESQFELGAKYASGDEVRQDYAEAVKWFTRAADGGQVLAAATLGAYYWAGRGVLQDDISAYMWSSIAKDGGDEASKYRLAILRARMTANEISEAEQRAAAWRQSHLPLAARRTTQK